MATTKPRKVTPLPDGKPPVFDARAEMAKAEVAYPPFGFIGLDGGSYELPHAQMISGSDATKIQSAAPGEEDQALDDLMTKVAPEAWVAIQAMPSAVARACIKGWYATIGLDDDDEDSDEGKDG